MKARMLVALALLFTCAVLAAPLPKPKPKKPQELGIEALQGLWEVKSKERGIGPNAALKANMAITTTQKFVRITDDTWTFLRADRTTAGTRCVMRLEPGPDPKAPFLLDLELALNAAGVARPIGVNAYMVGLVEMEGNTMKFCYTLRKARPAGMKPQTTTEYLITLERVEK
jgi:uncharacterized protein (TIGR03067 family)